MESNALKIRKIKKLITAVGQQQSIANADRIPDIIMVRYSAAENEWIIHEDCSKTKKQKYKREEVHFPELRDYVFKPDFSGSVIIDMMDHPNGDLFAFKASDIRKEYNLKHTAFSLNFLGSTAEEISGKFEIIVYESEDKIS